MTYFLPLFTNRAKQRMLTNLARRERSAKITIAAARACNKSSIPSSLCHPQILAALSTSSYYHYSSSNSRIHSSLWHLSFHHPRHYSSISSRDEEDNRNITTSTNTTAEEPLSKVSEVIPIDDFSIIDATTTSPSLSSNIDITRILSLSMTEGPSAAAMEVSAQLGSWPSDYAIRLVELLHEVTGTPYWLTIIGTTIALRTLLFPLVISTAKNAAKMTIMRPEMDAITEKMKAGPSGDRATQQRYQREIMGLFQKYDCYPVRSLAGPLGNMMCFIPIFFGLRRMGEYVPDFAQGGIEWFVDLGAPDPTYILPIVVTGGFVAVTEIGMDGMQMNQQMGPQMKFIFRILPVVMLPFTATMPTGCLLYWGSSNAFSILQTLALKNKRVKKYLGIPEIPSNISAAQSKDNPFKKLLDSFEERKKNKAVADAEIMHGGRRPPPPPSSGGGSTTVTYTQPHLEGDSLEGRRGRRSQNAVLADTEIIHGGRRPPPPPLSGGGTGTTVTYSHPPPRRR